MLLTRLEFIEIFGGYSRAFYGPYKLAKPSSDVRTDIILSSLIILCLLYYILNQSVLLWYY